MFGWEFQDMEGPQEYHMTRLSENSGGAIFPGDTGAIRVYFDVDDIKAGASRVNELGGKADDPQPVPTMGWFVTGTDTEGNLSMDEEVAPWHNCTLAQAARACGGITIAQVKRVVPARSITRSFALRSQENVAERRVVPAARRRVGEEG